MLRTLCKSNTATRYIERKHFATAYFSYEKKKRLLIVYESRLRNQQALLESAFRSDDLVILALFKLVFDIGKHKMPFSSCTAFLEFVKCTYPNYFIFSKMPFSRDTITKHTQQLH